jgi:hypothetical protein
MAPASAGLPGSIEQDVTPDAGTFIRVARYSPSLGQLADDEQAGTAHPLVIGWEDPRFES